MKHIVFFLFVLFFIVGCNAQVPITPDQVEGPGPYDDFAKCIKDSGLKIYGSYACSVCKKQRELFGSSFHYIGEIECHPRGENPQTQLCLEKDVAKTPTWILEKEGEELHRIEGYQTLETLAEISGCALEEQ